MRHIFLIAFGCLSSIFLAAQNTNYFFKTLNAERGATTCLDPSGDLWLGTREQGRVQLIKMRPDGTVLDRAYLNIPGGTGTSDNLAEILVDSEGKLVGCGNSDEFFGPGFAFRYDPTDRKLLWANTFETIFSNITSGIMEREPGGHFTAVSSSFFGNAELLTFDRLTGKLIADKTRDYHHGEYRTLNAAVLHKGFFFTTGTDEVPLRPDFHLGTSKISLATGTVQWANLRARDPLQHIGDLIGQDIIVDNDSIVSAVQGGPFNTTLLTHTIMQKTTLDGTLLWAKRYALYSPNERASAVVEEVTSVPDGYVLFGRTFDGGAIGSAFFLIKTDKKGQPKWARLLGKNWALDAPLLSYQNQVLAAGDALYIICDAKDANGLQRVFFFKTDLNGNVEGCDHIQAVGVQAFDLNNPKNEAVTLSTSPSEMLVQIVQVTPQIGAAPVFATPCEVKASCLNLPDATLRLSNVTCAGGSRTAHFSLCNLGSDTLWGDVALGFYPKDPLKDSTQRIASLILKNLALAPGACAQRSEPLDSLGIGQYAQVYALAGAADVPTPIAIANFPLGNSPTECNYANNLIAWNLDVKGTAPSLGPDLSICPGKSATLSTAAPAIGYLWQDGSAAATFTATAAGLYWIETTDACGAKQRDSLRVTVLPTPMRSQTVQFVQGGSVTLGGTAYTQPGPVVLTVPSATGGCDSLITYLLEWVPAEVKIACPANVTTAVPLGQTTATVNYLLPTAITNCPDLALIFNRLEGPAPGSALGEGTVKVCYQATDNCSANSSCCFNVTVNAAPPPCESKTVGCLRYELFSFQQDAASRTYRLRVVNNCASSVQTLNFQLPSGTVAASPSDGAVYAVPSGRQYEVRNASATPFHSLRFKAKTSGIPSGQSDYFEYKLPNQIAQGYLLAFGRLANGETYQAHLSTSNCSAQAAAAVAADEVAERSRDSAETRVLNISPNPTAGALALRLPESWQGQSVHVSVLNAQGQLVQEMEVLTADGMPLPLTLDGRLSRGLYYLLAQTAEGQRAAARVVLN